MPIKKTQLYSSLWKSCDEMRGGMDASQYKDYILVLLFVKYVSDKYSDAPFATFRVPAGGSFQDMVAAKGEKDIGDRINKILAKLAEANNLQGVITLTDFNNPDKLGKGKEMVDRLSKLIAIFEDKFDFSRNRAEGDDILGDAYEYLMRNFATEAGKSKGQFYTPAEVSRVMAQVVGISHATSQDQTVYDPTCGSGSLLIKAADEAPHGITIYGQEMDNQNKAMAQMNMILHGHPTAELWQDNTLAAPHYKNPYDPNTLLTFDFAVANPPFSSKAWSNGFHPEQDIYRRFEYGLPPAKNGDYAFLLHLLKSLKSKGKAAIILPHGVLFRGNAEAAIREKLIRRGLIKGLIALPPNLFYGTGIPACIIVIDKENADQRKGIFMIDAGRGFVKDGNKNRLRHQDIHKIVDVFNNQLEIPKYARMVSHEEIERNEYNLNLPRYIDSQEPEDRQDIEAHLWGGIPQRDVDALAHYWQVFPTLRGELLAASGREHYSHLLVAPEALKETIYQHPEFLAYAAHITQIFAAWCKRHRPALAEINRATKPKELIQTLAEDLLKSYAAVQLLDKYDIYQQLMSYWTDTMQDDVYQLALDGWTADRELVPPALIIARYFAAEQSAVERLAAVKEEITRQREELEEEYSGEGEKGYFEECRNDKGKIAKAEVQKRWQDLQAGRLLGGAEVAEERKILGAYLNLAEREAQASKRVKASQAELERRVAAKYGTLAADEVKTLVLDDKWLATLEAAITGELERIAQGLTQRLETLATRYATPLPHLAQRVAALTAQVERHLAQMGFA